MEAGGAAAAEAQKRLLRTARRLLAGAVRGLLAGAVFTLALLSTGNPELTNGRIAHTGFVVVTTGVVNTLVGELLAGPLDATTGEQALECALEVATHIATGSIPVLFAMLPTIGGVVAVLVVVAAAVGAIAAAAKAAAAGVHVVIACGVALAAQFLLATKVAA